MATDRYVEPIDLKDALAADDKFFLERGFPRLRGHQLIVDAARRVANPDYKAAFRHGKEVLAALGAEFTDEDEQQIKAIVDAAFGITTEDNDGD